MIRTALHSGLAFECKHCSIHQCSAERRSHFSLEKKHSERTLGGHPHQWLVAGKSPRFTSNGFGTVRRLERPTEQLWDVDLGQTLCDAHPLSHRCQKKFNKLFPFRDLGGKRRQCSVQSMGARYTPTLPNRSRLCPHLRSTCIDLVQTKEWKTPSLTATSVPPHSSNFVKLKSPWSQWKKNRTGTSWHPQHGTALGTRRAVTHLRHLRASVPVSCLKPLLFQWPFQHFPIPVWWF